MRTVVVDLPGVFRWNRPIGLTAGLLADASAVHDGYALSDVSHTLVIADSGFFDGEGSPGTDVDVQSASGLNPFAHAAPVPVTGAFVLLASGPAGLGAGRRTRRSQGTVASTASS